MSKNIDAFERLYDEIKTDNGMLKREIVIDYCNVKQDLERLAKIDNVDKHEVQDVVGFLKHNGAYQSSRTIQSLIDVIDATND